MTILGIDPGSHRVGYGIVQNQKGRLRFIDAGTLTITSPQSEAWGTLVQVKRGMDKILSHFQPDMLGIESLFFTKNKKTGIQVAHARGVILLSALEYGVRIREFTPNQVKAGVTGYGQSDKRGVAKATGLLLGIPALRLVDDAMDALAVAIVASSYAPGES